LPIAVVGHLLRLTVILAAVASSSVTFRSPRLIDVALVSVTAMLKEESMVIVLAPCFVVLSVITPFISLSVLDIVNATSIGIPLLSFKVVACLTIVSVLPSVFFVTTVEASVTFEELSADTSIVMFRPVTL